MTAPSRKRPTVLVVDDSVEAQEVLRENLEGAGYEVLLAANGRDALVRLVEQATPSLAIVDLLMPVMDGMELIEVLRSYRRLADLPVLVVSAVDLPAGARPARVQYLRKPVLREQLLDAVQSLLGTRAASQPG